MYKTNKPSIFTAQMYDTKVSVEIDHSDLDMNEVMDAFHTLLIGMGYSDSSFREWVKDRAGDYVDEDIADGKIMMSVEDDDVKSWNEYYDKLTYPEKYVANLPEEDIDAALAQHNSDEQLIEDDFDDYGMRTHNHD